jgi:hypothetical protein
MIIYPPSIINDDTNRPVIIFRNKVSTADTDKHIVFPIPQSLQFGDSATYNNSELDFLGSVVLNGGRQQSVGEATTAVLNQVKAGIPNTFKELAGALGSTFTKGNVQSAIGVATGTTRNKNIVTEFSGVGTRQFSFQFKLMATSQQESNIIKEIVDIFRLGLYPTGNSFQLNYPPTWYINFKKGGRDIPYIPKIFETYLTGMSTSYNSSMNLFHADGSPVEIDLQLTFMESRALTKGDVQSLIEKPFQDGDFTRVFQMSSDVDKSIAANNAAVSATEAVAAAEAAKNTTSETKPAS